MTPEDLRAIRLRHDLSQAEFAEMMKVSAACVSQWERGKRPIPLWIDEFYGYALLKRAGISPIRRGPGRPPLA